MSKNPRRELRAVLKFLANARDPLDRVKAADLVKESAVEVLDVELLQALEAGHTQQAIAARLGISQGAVSQRVQVARKRQSRRAVT